MAHDQVPKYVCKSVHIAAEASLTLHFHSFDQNLMDTL